MYLNFTLTEIGVCPTCGPRCKISFTSLLYYFLCKFHFPLCRCGSPAPKPRLSSSNSVPNLAAAWPDRNDAAWKQGQPQRSLPSREVCLLCSACGLLPEGFFNLAHPLGQTSELVFSAPWLRLAHRNAPVHCPMTRSTHFVWTCLLYTPVATEVTGTPEFKDSDG